MVSKEKLRRVSLLLIYRSTLVKVCKHKFSNLLIKKYHTFLGFYCFPIALLFALFCFILFLYHIVFFLWNLLLNKLEFALDLHYWCCYLRIPDFLSLNPLCFALCPFWFLLIHQMMHINLCCIFAMFYLFLIQFIFNLKLNERK